MEHACTRVEWGCSEEKYGGKGRSSVRVANETDSVVRG